MQTSTTKIFATTNSKNIIKISSNRDLPELFNNFVIEKFGNIVPEIWILKVHTVKFNKKQEIQDFDGILSKFDAISNY